jgi:hypothetical protein
MTLKLFHHPRPRTIGYHFGHVKGDSVCLFRGRFTHNQSPPEPQKTYAKPVAMPGTDGAQREGRTPTLLREPDFESGASASSAIRA